jgi:putative transposase
MARQPRYVSPGLAQHVVQRGNNKGRVFCVEDDFQLFRECLLSATRQFDCHVHAYVFMTNHVHLLVTPAGAAGIGNVMQAVGRRYVPRFNRRYDRSGALWEGRYRATVVDSERYLFTCQRYIELNPVRAGMVGDASAYRWSSYAANALGRDHELVSPHDLYLALSVNPASRLRAYRALFDSGLPDQELREIRDATHKAGR